MKKTTTLAFASIALTANAPAPSDTYIQGIMATGNLPGAEAVIIKDGNGFTTAVGGLLTFPITRRLPNKPSL